MRGAQAPLALAGVGEVWLTSCPAHHVRTDVRTLAHQAAVLGLAVFAVWLAHGCHALDRRGRRKLLSGLDRLGAVCGGRLVDLLVLLARLPAARLVVVAPGSSRRGRLLALLAVGLVAFLGALLSCSRVPFGDRLASLCPVALLLRPRLWSADAARAPLISGHQLASLAVAFWGNALGPGRPLSCGSAG